MATDKPSLELHAEIDTADGLAQYRWGATERSAENRPQSITCSSTLMNGYAQGSCFLPRHINKDYGDLGLFDTIRFVGADGRIAYEGRGSRFPREASTVHRATAEAVGWMSHARDRPILFLGLDGRLSSWNAGVGARADALAASGFKSLGAGQVSWDRLQQYWEGAWVAGELPMAEAWFDAGPGQAIGSIYYSSTPHFNTNEADPAWAWTVYVSSDTILTAGENAGNLSGAPPNFGLFTPVSQSRRYAFTQLYYNAAGGAPATQYGLAWARLVAYGNHGLPQIGSAAPYGLAGSDLIKHTAGLAAPLLDTSNVLTTSHPIELFTFTDAPTAVYDMWLVANQYERWNLAVWDDRKLYYEPLPDVSSLQSADWVLRSDHKNGLTRNFDGATTDGQANGVIVRFQNNVTGAADMIDPTTNPELADTNTQLAANRAGIRVWEPIQLPNPNSPAGAAKIGVAALTEFNRRRTPSRASIRGHLQDSAGNWHQGWTVRAGDTIEFPEDEDDPIRVVYETSWNHDSRELTINADAASKTIDAIIADQGLQ